MCVQLSVFPQSCGKDNCREVPSILGGFIFAAKVELDSNPAKVFDFLVEHRAREPVRSDSVAQKAPWRIFFLEYRDLISQAAKVTVFEKENSPGDLLSYGIGTYR